jgi:hypothetical protein
MCAVYTMNNISTVFTNYKIHCHCNKYEAFIGKVCLLKHLPKFNDCGYLASC